MQVAHVHEAEGSGEATEGQGDRRHHELAIAAQVAVRDRTPREPDRRPADPAERGPEDRLRSEPGDHAGLGAERAEERARDPRAREHGEDPGAHQSAEGDRERDVPRAAGEEPRHRLALEAPRGEPVHDPEQRRNDDVKPHGHLEVEQPATSPHSASAPPRASPSKK